MCDSCHFEYRQRIQSESRCDIVFGAPLVQFDALTSAEGDCGARMMLQTQMPSSVTPQSQHWSKCNLFWRACD